MPESNYEFWIKSEGRGFFGCPSIDPNIDVTKDYHHRPDLACAIALDQAKRGNFTLIPSILDLYRTTGRQIIDSMIQGIVAYAGPASCFDRIVEVVKSAPELQPVLAFCGIMAVRGELSYVPIFLEKYRANQAYSDAAYMGDYIDDILGGNLAPVDPDEFSDQVLDRYNQLLKTTSNERMLCFRGRLYSVPLLGEHLLEAVRRPYFQPSWRRSFEAATGIDCSPWYVNGILQPLAATAILEEFLDSPEIKKYKPGIRYFFGHVIPDRVSR